LSKDIYCKILYLCNKIHEVEWSGVLFYDVKGNIRNPSKMSCTVKDILPMDMGSAAYTEYSFDSRVNTYIEKDDERFDWFIGHIHSHNNMKTFFSSTDMAELNDNSEHHNFYLSLIVNNNMSMTAKIAQRIQVSGITYLGNDKEGNTYKKSYSPNNEVLMIYDCEIQIEDFNTEFTNAVTKIISNNKKQTNKFKNIHQKTFDWTQSVSVSNPLDEIDFEEAIIYTIQEGHFFFGDDLDSILETAFLQDTQLSFDIDTLDNWIVLNSFEYQKKNIYKEVYKILDGFTMLYPELITVLNEFKNDTKI
jgi:proteasome lid subunit RPN8/RPN11